MFCFFSTMGSFLPVPQARKVHFSALSTEQLHQETHNYQIYQNVDFSIAAASCDTPKPGKKTWLSLVVLNLIFNITAFKLKDKSQKVLQGSASAGGVLMASFLGTLMLFCPVRSWGGVQTKCVRLEKEHNLVELNLTGQSKGGRHRPREALWALLSWHCFHPRAGDHATAQPGYVLQQDFSKITLFKYFIVISFFKPGSQTFKSEAILFS